MCALTCVRFHERLLIAPPLLNGMEAGIADYTSCQFGFKSFAKLNITSYNAARNSAAQLNVSIIDAITYVALQSHDWLVKAQFHNVNFSIHSILLGSLQLCCQPLYSVIVQTAEIHAKQTAGGFMEFRGSLYHLTTHRNSPHHFRLLSDSRQGATVSRIVPAMQSPYL